MNGDVYSHTTIGRADCHLGKVNIGIPYKLAISPLAIHPREMCTHVHYKTNVKMFMAALFENSKTRMDTVHS